MFPARWILAATLLGLSAPLLALEIPARPSEALVHDFSGTLSPRTLARLEERAGAVQGAGAAVAVLVRFANRDESETEADARRLMKAWRIEREPGRADGVVIVINLEKRDPLHGAAAIHAGAGLASGKLPSRLVKQIWREEMRPSLRDGRIAEGIASGLAAVEKTLREGPPPPGPTERKAAELATGRAPHAVPAWRPGEGSSRFSSEGFFSVPERPEAFPFPLLPRFCPSAWASPF